MEMDHKKISSKGGRTTKKRYGKQHFSDIGKKGGESKLKMYGIDYFKQLSQKGVEARRKKAEAKKGIVQRVVETIASI